MAMTLAERRRGAVDRYAPADRPALEAMQRQTFGAQAIQLDRDHFRWLFEEPPGRDAEGPQLWVCRRQGAIVGQQGGIPFALKAGDRICRASWAVDLMVAPAWRLRGVGPALSEAQAASCEVAVALGASEAAFKAYRRAGWIDLGTVPLYLRMLDATRCLKGRSQAGRRLMAAAAVAAGPLLTGTAWAAAGLARLAGTRLEAVAAFDERVDALWEAVAGRYPVLARRDRQYLRWRFETAPKAMRHHTFYLLRHGEPKGYLVLRLERGRSETVAVVVDYLARPGWMAALFAHAVEAARRLGAIAVACRTLNAPGHRALTALGFVCLRNGITAPARMLVHPGPGDLAGLIASPANWFVTAADADIGLKEMGSRE